MKDKKNETLYCIVIVLVLILIFCGDRIILTVIPKAPNPNNSVFGEKDSEIFDYASISFDDVIEKIKNQESFFLLFIRDDCFKCIELENKINYINNIAVPVYYVKNDTSNVEQQKAYQTLLNYDLRIKENSQYTPFLIKFKKGIVMEVLVGNTNDEYLRQFLTQI